MLQHWDSSVQRIVREDVVTVDVLRSQQSSERQIVSMIATPAQPHHSFPLLLPLWYLPPFFYPLQQRALHPVHLRYHQYAPEHAGNHCHSVDYRYALVDADAIYFEHRIPLDHRYPLPMHVDHVDFAYVVDVLVLLDASRVTRAQPQPQEPQWLPVP